MVTETLKESIKSCITEVHALSDKLEAVKKCAMTELPKEDAEVFIHLMDLCQILRQSKGVAERTLWCLNKH